MGEIALRPYQKDALNSVWQYWSKEKGNPLVVAATGSGKSLIIAAFIKQVMSYPGTRVLCLTHMAEILEQNEEALLEWWPEAPTGVFSSGLGRKERNAPILFAGIQSIWRQIHHMDPFDIIVSDESHTIGRKSNTMYGKALEVLKLQNPNCRMVGFTASPMRMDSGRLDKGDDALFDKIVYEIGVQDLIDKGYLCEVISKRGVRSADTSKLHRRQGEFIAKEVEASQQEDGLVESCCDEIVFFGHGRKSWLIYGTSIEHAEHIQSAMRDRGVDAKIVTGKTPKHERRRILEDFKGGSLKCLINIAVAIAGFNAPRCDLVALMFSTASTTKYIQVVGRALRNYPGKKNALLLDYGGNVERHGPIDQIKATEHKEGSGEGEAPAKSCPDCFTIVHAAARECPDCGYEFPPPKPKHERTAYDGAVLSSQNKPQWIAVDSVQYKRHKKQGKPDSVRAEYICGLKTYTDWLCPEHGGKATMMTARKLALANIACPRSTDEMLEAAKDWPQPSFIKVKPEGKYERVEAIHYGSAPETNARAENVG